MKMLDGSELASYIKSAQAHEVRSIWGTKKVKPKLVVVQDGKSELNNLYTQIKSHYAVDIGAEFVQKVVEPSKMPGIINTFNQDNTVHGVIVQLPLSQPELTDEVIEAISPDKDVDGLKADSKYEPATPLAVLWLLAGYNIDLIGKTVAVVGQGRLVGGPLSRMLELSGVTTIKLDEHSADIKQKLVQSDVIITATGQPGLIKSDMVKTGAVVVDAGTASDGGAIVGDADPALYEREDLTITPRRGGVGPLTVCALFGNLLRSTRTGGKS